MSSRQCQEQRDSDSSTVLLRLPALMNPKSVLVALKWLWKNFNTSLADLTQSGVANARRGRQASCVISCLESCLGLRSALAGLASGNEETQIPNRTGNLIRPHHLPPPSLSSSINLPSGPGAINKEPTLCDTLAGGMEGAGLRPQPQGWQIPTASFSHFPRPKSRTHAHTHTHTQGAPRR